MLPPSGEVARSADRGSHVILSVSEISHDQSEKVQTLRKFTLPGDCFVVSLPRNDKQKVRHIERKRNIPPNYRLTGIDAMTAIKTAGER